MQFEEQPGGKKINLLKPSIDTGMGLERIAAVMQGVYSNYDIDPFKALIGATADLVKNRSRRPSKAFISRDRRSFARDVVPDRRRRFAQ